MANNHRLQPIADPYLNARRQRQADEATMRHLAGAGWSPDDIRMYFQMPSVESYPSVEGRSAIVDPMEHMEPHADGEVISFPQTSDADLMPDTDAPISVTKRAFGESGHGFSVRQGRKGQ